MEKYNKMMSQPLKINICLQVLNFEIYQTVLDIAKTEQKMLKILKGKKKKNEKSTNKQKKCLHNIETLEKYELPSKC